MKLYHCEFCSSHFADMDHLKSHRELHVVEKPYTCNHCNTTFKSFAEAVLHWKEHPRIFKVLVVFLCEICDRDVKELSLLYKHKQKRHQPVARRSERSKEKFICELCGGVFASIEDFQEHGKYRCSKFPCDICGSLLPTANSLNAHKRRHSGLRPYVAKDSSFVTHKYNASLTTVSLISRVDTFATSAGKVTRSPATCGRTSDFTWA